MTVFGVSAQRGYQFQDYVALYYALNLLRNNELISVEVESTGLLDDSAIVHVDDVVLIYLSGYKKFVQIKSTAEGMITWNIKSLYQTGELRKIVQQLDVNYSDMVELICPHGFGNLEELWNDCSKFHDLINLKSGGSQAANERLSEFCRLAELDEVKAFSYVRRLSFGPRHRLEEWENLILERLIPYAKNPDRALDLLLKLIKDHQCKREGVPSVLTAKVFNDSFKEADLFLSDTDKTLATGVRARWKAESLAVHPTFPVDINPVDQTHSSLVAWERSGPLFVLLLRPCHSIGKKSIDFLEERFCGADISLPIFFSTLPKIIGRINEGLCSYEQWTQPALPPTFCQRLMSKISSQFLPSAREQFLNFSYINRDGELCMTYNFRLKSGYHIEHGVAPLPENIEQLFICALDAARATLRLIGEKSPYEGIAQISGGISDSILPILGDNGKPTGRYTNVCAESSIESSFFIPSENIKSAWVLRPFFSTLWESLSTKRPAYYNELNKQW